MEQFASDPLSRASVPVSPTYLSAATGGPVTVPPSRLTAPALVRPGVAMIHTPRVAAARAQSPFLDRQLSNVEGVLSKLVHSVDRIAETGLNTLDRMLGIEHQYREGVESPHIRRAAIYGAGAHIASQEYQKSRKKGKYAPPSGSSDRDYGPGLGTA